MALSAGEGAAQLIDIGAIVIGAGLVNILDFFELISDLFGCDFSLGVSDAAAWS